jgi:hypothetical protein
VDCSLLSPVSVIPSAVEGSHPVFGVHPQDSHRGAKAPMECAFSARVSACAPPAARDPSASVGMTEKGALLVTAISETGN